MDTMNTQITRNLLLLLGALTISSCSREVTINRQIEVDRDSIKVVCDLNRMAPFDQDTSSFVFAELTIGNTADREIKFSLRQLSLNIPNRKSAGPYIDSIADILIKDEILAKKGSARHKVYWAIKPPVSASEIEQATMTISP